MTINITVVLFASPRAHDNTSNHSSCLMQRRIAFIWNSANSNLQYSGKKKLIHSIGSASQTGTVLGNLRLRQIDVGILAAKSGFIEDCPFPKRITVFLRLCHKLSFIKASHNRRNSLLLSRSNGRSQLMNFIPTLIMSATPTSVSIFLIAVANLFSVSASAALA